MSVNKIPEKIVNFNVYDNANKLVGISGEVTLPDMAFMTETISGAGIAGEYESPTIGHAGSMELEIPFRVLHDKTFNMLGNAQKTIVLRGSQQSNDIAKGEITHEQVKITVRGMGKGSNLGKFGVGAPVDSSCKIEVLYLKVDVKGVNILEYDKLNFIFIVNSVDLLQQIRSQI